MRLVSLLNDSLAPIYIIRLWGYVQTRRSDLIPDDAETLKAICRWHGGADDIRAAMLSCGWLKNHDGGLLVHGWSELNTRLIHNWTVGATGGKTRVTTAKSKAKPKANPRLTQGQTLHRWDRIGLDRIGVEQHLSPGGDGMSDFELFWKAYPRKTGKKLAERAWRKAKDKPEIECVLTTIKAAMNSDQWQKENGQYIPLPATWLNQGRWADEPTWATPTSAPTDTKQAIADATTARAMREIPQLLATWRRDGKWDVGFQSAQVRATAIREYGPDSGAIFNAAVKRIESVKDNASLGAAGAPNDQGEAQPPAKNL